MITKTDTTCSRGSLLFVRPRALAPTWRHQGGAMPVGGLLLAHGFRPAVAAYATAADQLDAPRGAPPV